MAAPSLKLPFRSLQPVFYAGLLDDPVLLVRIRPAGRALLFDCGQIHHLAKRVIRSLDAVFVSHAHMDHFMGIDTLVRNVHVAPRTIEIYGPPGLAGRLASKLAGYDWNLAEDHWASFRVREVHPGRLRTFLLAGPAGFELKEEGETPLAGEAILAHRHLTVSAVAVDHKIPSLAFRLTERPSFSIDPERLREEGLVGGPWVRELKKRFFAGALTASPLTVCRAGSGGGRREEVTDAAALYQRLRRRHAPPSMGYLTDVGFSPENRRRLRPLLDGVTLLVCECTFLAADREKARESFHFCTSDLNALLAEVRPPFVLPMHLSKSYVHRCEELYRELRPPPGTTVLRLPPHVAPRPLLPEEVPVPTADR